MPSPRRRATRGRPRIARRTRQCAVGDRSGGTRATTGTASAASARRFQRRAECAADTVKPRIQWRDVGLANIVYAGNYGNALCGVGATQGTRCPPYASNPFPAGTFHGEIVICDRGIYARVEKGYNVKAAGAGAFTFWRIAQTDGESGDQRRSLFAGCVSGLQTGMRAELEELSVCWGVARTMERSRVVSVGEKLMRPADISELRQFARAVPGFSGGILKPDNTVCWDRTSFFRKRNDEVWTSRYCPALR